MRRRKTFALLLLTAYALAGVAQTQRVNEPQAPSCGSAPICSEPQACRLQDITQSRDERSCKRTLIFNLQFNDPACEAEKAAFNQRIEFQRAILQQDYRQCLVAQESHRTQCEVKQTEWEACISRVLPQFPPRSVADRKFLYQRCTRNGGRDEFTSDCCTHLYAADRSTLGVCASRNQPPNTPR
jgi:hypothetical protein